MTVAVNDEEVDGTLHEIVVTFVVGQDKVIEIELAVGLAPVVVANGGEEAEERRASSIGSGIGINILVIILPDVLIDRGGVRVVAHGDDEIGVPILDEICDIPFRGSRLPIIANAGKANGCARWEGWRSRWRDRGGISICWRGRGTGCGCIADVLNDKFCRGRDFPIVGLGRAAA